MLQEELKEVKDKLENAKEHVKENVKEEVSKVDHALEAKVDKFKEHLTH